MDSRSFPLRTHQSVFRQGRHSDMIFVAASHSQLLRFPMGRGASKTLLCTTKNIATSQRHDKDMSV